jgi:UDP-2-acetamido-3-amino-2,3-dideoxy-glucuronate N-acetyltransferase
MMPDRMGASVGVVGGGNWGKNLIRNHANLGSLAAICELSQELREAYSQQYQHVDLYENADAMLSNSDIDAVVVATPAITHGALIKKALEAGKHVFVEKPLCLDVEEARSLGAQAEKLGKVLMVGHLLRYHPAFLAIQHAIEEGAIGPLRYIYSNRLNLGQIRREENALWSFAPHDISMILALSGNLPDRVTCDGGAYLSQGIADTTMSYLYFPDNLKAHVFVSWLHPYKDQRLVVIGERGMIVFDDVAKGVDKLLLYPHRIGWKGEAPETNKADAKAISYGNQEPLAEECRAFLDACENGTKVPTDAAEGLRVLQVLDACQRALSSGEAVGVAP